MGDTAGLERRSGDVCKDAEPQDQASALTTLYPKIRKLADFIHEAKKLPEYQSPSASIHLTGSTKLHGTHADIVFASATSGDIRLQSRNVEALVPGVRDNEGFASYIASLKKSTILDVRDRLVARYRKMNPGTPVEGPIIVAGEWCGSGIQSKVAICQIPKFFAIVSTNVNGSWVPDWEYADICDEGARIYHVGKAGFVEHKLRFGDVAASEVEIKRLTDEVERECPFARAVNGKSGHGEGIVWKSTHHCGSSSFWFKSKGDILAVSHSSKLLAPAVDKSNKERVDKFARAIVTEIKLQQGWDYLASKDATGMGPFLKWVAGDCLEEEKREMEILEVTKSRLIPAIDVIAKSWFWGKVKEEQRVKS